MSERVRYAFPLPEVRHVLGPFTAGQVAVGSGALLVVVFGILRPHPTPTGVALAVGLLAVTAPVVLVPVGGRAATAWLPILLVAAARRLRGQARYRAARPWAGNPGQQGPLPAELGRLAFLAHPVDGTELGVLADRAAGTYTAVLAVDPPAFLLEAPDRQEQALAGWGRVLARLAQPASHVHRLQWVLRTQPDDGHGPRRWLDRARARDLDEAAQVVRSYLALLRAVTATTVRHATLLAVQVAAARSQRAVRAAGGGDAGACQVLAQALSSLTSGLAELGCAAHPLNTRAYQGLLRVAFDPDAAGHLTLLAAAHPERGWGSAWPWPVATEERWGCYRTADRAWHRSFTLALPALEVAADWLAPMVLDATATRTVAVTLTGTPTPQATRQAKRALTRLRAEDERKQRLGQLHAAEDAKRQHAAQQRLHELADGHALVTYAATVTVTAPTLDALGHACRQLEHAAAMAGCELLALDGQQAQAFGWTLPLARGVD